LINVPKKKFDGSLGVSEKDIQGNFFRRDPDQKDTCEGSLSQAGAHSRVSHFDAMRGTKNDCTLVWGKRGSGSKGFAALRTSNKGVAILKKNRTKRTQFKKREKGKC